MKGTVEDVSSTAEPAAPVPAIALVQIGARPSSLVLTLPAELGRRTCAGSETHELDDDKLSRDHATIAVDHGLWVITDRASRNGTFVDGERVQGEVRRRGDVVVRLGHCVFLLIASGSPASAPPAGPDEPIVGAELARVYDQIRRHAQNSSLLIHGESGTGKELAAQLYHLAGPRKAGPFVAINCATIPEGVAEPLLFGSRRGAFSGAIDSIGHFQKADGGTLFLDEIADLDAAVQAKLLRAIESREVVPVGAITGAPVDIGIVAASHRDLRAAVADRKFRDDLYFRLAQATVEIPPLRARKLDLARLVQREVSQASRNLLPHARFLEACCVRPWPGNIRELRAAVRQAASTALAAGRDLVRPEDLAATAGMPLAAGETPPIGDRPRASSTEITREAILAALERSNGVVSVAARELGLHRTQLYRLMDKYGIARGES